MLKAHEATRVLWKGEFVFQLNPSLISSLRKTSLINKMVPETLGKKWSTGLKRDNIVQFVGLSQRCSILRSHKELSPLLS